MTITQIIKQLAKDYGKDPIDINDGDCWLFAGWVIEQMGGESEELYESYSESLIPGHVWITYKGKHYDVECPEGVNDPDMLPCMQRIKGVQSWLKQSS